MDPRWQQLFGRCREADGHFWYSVSSTGVYCRPSCPAKHAARRFITLHETLQEAQATGFRPCRRCRPDQLPGYETNRLAMLLACRAIAEADRELPLRALAAMAGMSASHFHRLFKAHTGTTPKGYWRACIEARMRGLLPSSSSVTQAVFEAGYASSAQFYGATGRALGMRPVQYRNGGEGAELHFALGECSLGTVLVASTTKGVACVMLGDSPDEVLTLFQQRFRRARLIGGDRVYERLVASVVGAIESSAGVSLPLDIKGTIFQRQVWDVLRDVPSGHTITYREIARRLGVPRQERAVAAACAANPVAVLIPCHRVVRDDGNLWGYAWGIERKRSLLQRESSKGSTTSTR